jgi:hypothetical protein
MINYRISRRLVSLALTLTAAITLAVPVGATDTVTQTVTAGPLTASVADLALPTRSYAHTAQTSTGTMTLTADDSTGLNLGWNVTIQTSAFVYSGGNGGTNIPAANFSLTSAAEPVMTAGQAVDTDTDGGGLDTANGPKVPSTSPVGTLNSARKTVQANPLYGNGTYTQALGVSLTIPAQSAAGTYTGTLTTTISAAP